MFGPWCVTGGGFPKADRLQGWWIYYQRTSQQVDQFALYIHKSKRTGISRSGLDRTDTGVELTTLLSAVDGANIWHCRCCWSRLYRPRPFGRPAAKVIAYYAQNKTLRLQDFQLAHARADSIVYLEDEAPEQDSSQRPAVCWRCLPSVRSQ